MYFAQLVFARVTDPRISAATLLNRIPTLIVWRGTILFFPAVLRAWQRVPFSHFWSTSFFIFGHQNLCLALPKVFSKAKWPPLSFESWSCSKTVSLSPCGTTSCFCVVLYPPTYHFLYSTPSVSSSPSGPRGPTSLLHLSLTEFTSSWN